MQELKFEQVEEVNGGVGPAGAVIGGIAGGVNAAMDGGSAGGVALGIAAGAAAGFTGGLAAGAVGWGGRLLWGGRSVAMSTVSNLSSKLSLH